MIYEIDRELSLTFAAKSTHNQKNSCWLNATKNMLFIDELARGFYVEGFAVTNDGLIVEHGWNELDGRIIDTTPGYCEEKGVMYFACAKYNKAEVSQLTRHRLPTKTIHRDPEYVATLQAAKQYRDLMNCPLRTQLGKLHIQLDFRWQDGTVLLGEEN